MKQKTFHQLLPLIITMAVGSFLTVLYFTRTSPAETQLETKNASAEKKPRNEFMIWQSLSRHLLSID